MEFFLEFVIAKKDFLFEFLRIVFHATANLLLLLFLIIIKLLWQWRAHSVHVGVSSAPAPH